MSRRNLEYLLAPRSVAVIGASDRPQSLGATVIRNLLCGDFDGPVWPVNLRHDTVAGRPAFHRVADLPAAPDLAVICTPARTVPGLIRDLGKRGTRAAIVLSAGLEATGEDRRTLSAAMLDAARPYLLRILGPNCVGLLAPRIGLNASFAHINALPGNLAFIAQSGALTTAMLDWAVSQNIGFSYFISIGNGADVDFADLLDFLREDLHTRAILLYVESISGARKFMSAARAAARSKPVIVVKAGRVAEGAAAAATHTGALAGSDDVYDAAFRRAGMLRVRTTRELFDAAATLAHVREFSGERLAIVSNGGGPAVLATDALVSAGGTLAHLSRTTLEKLNAALPSNWSHRNPVDIVGDAPAERYASAIEIVSADRNVDALLLIHAPTAIVPAPEIARACLPALTKPQKPVFTCWMGGNAVREAEELCAANGIPTYGTPEEAVTAFLQVVEYQKNQRQLMEVPASIPESLVSHPERVLSIINGVLREERTILTQHEACKVLEAYGIPVAATRVAADISAAERAAREIGYPVVLKILSPDITHKSDLGGVALNIGSGEQLRQAAEKMLQRCREWAPSARITGFTVQPMIERSNARELIAGIAMDATFGPIMLFGQGGTAVEVIGDRAVALPPLNLTLAADLISRTAVYKLLKGYRDQPAADMRAIELVLVQLSQLVIDIPNIVELDINPLLADEHGVIALDARIRVARVAGDGQARLAIRPYPKELEERVMFEGHEILLRPIRPEDLPQHRAFLARVTPEDLRTRFFHAIRTLPERDLAYLTQIDYERSMAFIAVGTDPDGKPETLGVVRAHTDPENDTAEFAVLVRSDLKGRGLGTLLLKKLVRYCESRGTARLVGDVLSENKAMLRLANSLGFRCEKARSDVARVTLDLASAH